MATVAERIREARIGAGLEQEQVAAALNVTVRSVGGWERGGQHPRPKKLRALAELFGRPVSWFFHDGEAEAASALLRRIEEAVAQGREDLDHANAPTSPSLDEGVQALRRMPEWAQLSSAQQAFLLRCMRAGYVRTAEQALRLGLAAPLI